MPLRLAGLVAVLLLALCGAAEAADPFWHTTYPSTDGFDLQDVSCPTLSLCIAVGASGEAVVQDGTYQYETRPESVPSFNAISCAPGQRFCMAGDNQGNVVPWDNGEFGGVDNIDGDVELQSISCATAISCEAIDHNHKVFRYGGPSGWDAGLTLTAPAGFAAGSSRVACASPTFCMAVASGSGGISSVKYNGTWSTTLQSVGSVAGARAKSLTCTSASFCLMTDSKGVAALYNGTTWTATSPSTTQLWAGCSGTTCRAIDQNVKAYVTTNGTTWSPSQDIHAGTGLSIPSAVACAAPDLCAATSGGLTSTFARSIVPTTKPVLSGTGKIGETLTVAHAPVEETRAWYADQWFRCDNPGSTCTRIPDVNGTSYSPTVADAGKYIDARDITGVGLDQEGKQEIFQSNAVQVEAPAAATPTASPGPTAPPSPSPTPTPTPAPAKPVAAKLTGRPKVSKTKVSLTLTCAVACSGKVALKGVGSASYSVAAGKKKRLSITLSKAARKKLKKKHKLKTTLTITPKGGKAVKQTVTLKR